MKRFAPLLALAGVASVAFAADSTQPFAQDFFQQIRKTSKEPNIIFSPASIANVLGLARAGAAGATRAEIEKVLHGEPKRIEHDGVEVSNHIWAQKGAGIREDWKVISIDFDADPEKACATINERVAKETHGRIKDLLPKDAIDKDTKIVLTNAIHLLAKWVEPFEKDMTRDAPFHLEDGSKVNVSTMHGTFHSGARHGEKDGLTVVELPYKGTLVFDVIVPKDLSKYALDFDAALALLEGKGVEVALPRFELTAELDLKAPLVDLGMTTAFTNDADFSGFTGSKNLKVSRAVTKTFIRVDEEGTEAAAASGMVMKPTSLPPRVQSVKVDRPFIFAIRETKTGAVVFMGKVGKPVAPR